MDWNRSKKWSILSLLVVCAFILLVGCGSKSDDVLNSEKVEETLSEEIVKNKAEGNQRSGTSHFPITVVDDAGEEVTIESEPTSIVSFQPSTTEIAFELGLGDKIIGVSDYCNYPEEALEKQKVGARDMNAELVLTLMPDVAFVQEYHYESYPEVLEQYKEAGISVIVTGSATSFEEVYETIRMMADVTGTAPQAEEIISDMKTRLEVLKEKAEAVTEMKKVWVEVSPAPDIFTTGKGTFMHEMLESIRAINAASDQEGWVKLTEEEIVQLNPDVIITTYGYYIDNPSDGVYARQGWAEVPAIKDQQVFDVENDTVTRPGPRLIDGVETLAKFVYPEIFN